MFGSSPKQNGTQKNNLPSFLNDTNHTGLSRSFVPPKITSTPIHPGLRKDVFATPPKARLFSPKRYSLSDIATPPRHDRLKKSPPGPLLASTQYNVSLSTYEDTKSPGLVSRIVQYNEEVERESKKPHATHQERYGSPGLLPIVHLFKKKPPSLSQIPNSVNIRAKSPGMDHSRFHSEEYNKKLLEEIVRPVSTLHGRHFSSHNNERERGTRSVLDALKEISRKRIHSNEEYDLNEDSGKRLRTEIISNGEDSNKRQREDNSFDKSGSPPKQLSKKICVYDEYAASRSSMDFSTIKRAVPVEIAKRKNTSTSTEVNRESKVQKKLKSVETQTLESKTVDNEVDAPKEHPLPKVIDNVPLEVMRKSRLSALIGTLSGKSKDINVLPKSKTVEGKTSDQNLSPETSKESLKISESQEKINNISNSTLTTLSTASTTFGNNSSNNVFGSGFTPSTNSVVPPTTLKTTSTEPEKTLISILTSSKSVSPIKSNKHVHFNIPDALTQTSTSISTPIVSTAVSDTPQFNFGPPKVPLVAPTATSSPISTAVTPPRNIAFPPVSQSTFEVPKSTESSPKINFGINVPKSDSTVVSSPSSQKLGGFKFDLPKSVAISTVSDTSTTTTPMFSFGGSKDATESSTSATSIPTFNFAKPATSEVPKVPSFSFTPPKSTTATSNVPENKSNFSLSKSPSFQFKSPNSIASTSSTTSTTSDPIFGIPAQKPSFNMPGSTVTTSTTETTSIFNKNSAPFGQKQNENPFASSTNTVGANNSPFGATTPSVTPAFGSTTTTTNSSVFGGTISSNTFGNTGTASTNKSGFANPSNTTLSNSMFGVGPLITTPSAFGSTSSTTTKPSSFGGSTSTTQSFGGAAPTPSFGATGAAPSFGSTMASTPAFGGNNLVTTPSAFGGSSATATPTFGSTQPPAYGTTTASTFGTNTTSTFGTSTTSAFGTAASSTLFGTPAANANNFAFGAQNTSNNVFGGAKPTTTSSTNFGVVKPTFGTASSTNNAFNAQPSAVPAFGSNNVASPFGTTTTTTSTTANPFATTQPTFSFGSNKSSTSSFGSNSSFGSSTTTAPPSFGSTTPSGGFSFGATQTQNPPPAFGSTTATVTTASSTFGNNNSNVFGAQPSTTPAFNNPSNTAFGTGFSSSANSAFGTPQKSSSTFGTPAPSFGGNASSTTPSGGFNFGGAAAPKPAFAFGGGTATEAPKPSFNFTGGASNPPVFGAGNASSGTFGGAATVPNFGGNQFAAPSGGAAGVFNIGSGSSSRPRTQLKGKRRT